MCSAIKPSPIKALFDREELEVRPRLAISLPEISQKRKGMPNFISILLNAENQTQTRKRTTKKLYLHSPLQNGLFTGLS